MKSILNENEKQRDKLNRIEFIELLQRAMPNDGVQEPMEGLTLLRTSRTTETIHAVLKPSLCIIAQGSKEIYLGEERFKYEPCSFLLATMAAPVIGRVLEASEETPYLAIAISLDATLISSVLLETKQKLKNNQEDSKGIVVSPLDTTLFDTVLRLLRLLNSPSDVHILFPHILKEIIYRLLSGAQGHKLMNMTVLGGHSNRILNAIGLIRHNFSGSLQVKDIAAQVGMSVSSFHHHFKEVTAMSPLQFQKTLRLQEARHLMLGGNLDAAHAGFKVGYEDASHFNRDYKRLFGLPPMKDIERLRSRPR